RRRKWILPRVRTFAAAAWIRPASRRARRTTPRSRWAASAAERPGQPPGSGLGQLHREDGPPVGGFGCDFAAMRFGDLAHDEKAKSQAGPLHAAFLRDPAAPQRLEQQPQGVAGDGLAVIGDRQPYAVRALAQLHADSLFP